jgi:hypothetical protein
MLLCEKFDTAPRDLTDFSTLFTFVTIEITNDVNLPCSFV